MRPLAVLALFLSLSGGAIAQRLDYTSAPQQFLGYTMGSAESEVVAGLKQGGATFRQDDTAQGRGLSLVIVSNQTLDKLEHVTAELQFFHGTLFWISASLAYTPDAFEGLLTVLQAKYGPVRSNDGGFHYTWFYDQKDHNEADQRPDFAIILGNDPVDKKMITLAYVDNLRKSQVTVPSTSEPSGTPALSGAPTTSSVAPTPTPAPKATPAPALNPSSF